MAHTALLALVFALSTGSSEASILRRRLDSSGKRCLTGQDCLDAPNSQPGEYCQAFSIGTKICSDLTFGEEAKLGSTGKEKCTPGTYSTVDMTTCEPCAAGSIQPHPGNGRCSPTDAGYTSNAERTDQEACLEGTYAAFEGSSQCTLCEQGKFQPGKHSPACIPCTRGHATAEFGSPGTACTEADSDCTDIGVNCPACTPGRFQDQGGKSTCKPCDPGTFESGYGEHGTLHPATYNERPHPYSGKVTCECASAGHVVNKEGTAEGKCLLLPCIQGAHPAVAFTRPCLLLPYPRRTNDPTSDPATPSPHSAMRARFLPARCLRWSKRHERMRLLRAGLVHFGVRVPRPLPERRYLRVHVRVSWPHCQRRSYERRQVTTTPTRPLVEQFPDAISFIFHQTPAQQDRTLTKCALLSARSASLGRRAMTPPPTSATSAEPAPPTLALASTSRTVLCVSPERLPTSRGWRAALNARLAPSLTTTAKSRATACPRATTPARTAPLKASAHAAT